MSKTFNFYYKNSSATMTVSGGDFDEALEELKYHVSNPDGWRCDFPDGDEED